MRARAATLAGRRLSQAGVLVITAQRHRTQERNRQDALERLVALLREAASPPRKRVKTRVPYGQRKQRVDAKRRRSTVKRLRGPDEE